MLADSGVGALGPTTWADLGCGTGTFTLALADLLAPGSAIHATDIDGSALRKIPPVHQSVSITTHQGDFLNPQLWPFADLDGILMANSLHYVRTQKAFLRRVDAALRHRRMLLVEYDTTRGNTWVPYPVNHAAAVELFRSVGYGVATTLGRKRSVFGRGEIYGLLLTE